MYSDILLFSLIFIFASLGFIQGFSTQLISLLAWIGVVFFAQDLTQLLREASGVSSFAEAPFLIVWMGTVVAIFIFAALIRLLLSHFRKRSILLPLDRWLGFSLGALKGLLIAALLAVFFNLIPRDLKNQEITTDFSSSRLVKAGAGLVDWKSFELAQNIRSQIQRLQVYSIDESTNPSNPWLRESDLDRY